MKTSLVIFDLDGTLLDTLGDLTAAMNRTLTRHGLPERTRQQMRTALGNGARRLMELSVPTGTDSTLFETLLAEYNADYAAHCRIETAPYPGVAALLRTLPEREFRAGLAEIVKAGLIADPGLFELFERYTLQEFRTDRALLLDAVTRAVHVKADIVARDEQEHGDRRKLNLGHTFAHAVEKSSREFLHGEAVSIGLVMIAALSEQNGMLSPADAARIRTVVEKMGLPLASGIELPRLLQALKLDKKKESKSVNFVLMNGVGDCLIRPFSFDEIDKIVL